MTFEVKLLITFVATCLLVILTKFRQNPMKHVGEVAFSFKMTFLTLWPLHDLWGQTVDNFCSHLPTDASDEVSSKSNKACSRSSIFRKNDLFDPCDPYMTFEVKLLITFVVTHPLVILTKFGRNQIKRVEEEANCEKTCKNKNTTRSCALFKGTR